jgi:GntR family transcriptional regulator
MDMANGAQAPSVMQDDDFLQTLVTRSDSLAAGRVQRLGPHSGIDRRSMVPYYFQLALIMKNEILTGRWPQGARISGEPTLGQVFDVSRTTIRQALQHLEAEGLIERIKGRGTFVASTRPSTWLLQSSGGFFHEEVDRMGVNVTSRLLRAEMAELPAWAATALEQPAGDVGVTIERLRYVDGRAALYVIDYLPKSFGPSALQLRENESLYDLMQAREGVRVFGGRRSVKALSVGADLAALLEVAPRAPLVYIESVAWDDELRPFHCFASFVRSDRMPIEVQVTRSTSAAGGVFVTPAASRHP